MQGRVLQLDARDNVLIALADLHESESVAHLGQNYALATDVPAKHKFATRDLASGDAVTMYGVLVGRACMPIARGEVLTTRNLRHDSAAYGDSWDPLPWRAPEVSRWRDVTFPGFHRPGGAVGTRNYWIVIPLVFCENRNLLVLKQAFEEELGFTPPQIYRRHVAEMLRLHREGRGTELKDFAFSASDAPPAAPRAFPHVDGIKFLLHQGGCGGTREDAENLCGLLADYILHPNVAGATVLSLGCQNAQVAMLREQLARRAPKVEKPLLIFEQQQSGSEAAMLSAAVRDTFRGLVEADKATRAPAPLSRLCVGLKCGGSDGFSGISANPAIGYTADLLAALGGAGILSEFPELCGVEQELINRSVRKEVGDRFVQLMRDYAARAQSVRTSFAFNPSPGNIRDGLITDAMKSAGAAKKGGASPVTAVLDYPERVREAGLNLLCTPGNDVECVTAQVGAGANVVLFTTGLGTPTGNPVAPVIKLSSNSSLAARMADIIDFDCGPIVAGALSITEAGERILDLVAQVAGGAVRTKAEQLCQDDFIPWKRGISL